MIKSRSGRERPQTTQWTHAEERSRAITPAILCWARLLSALCRRRLGAAQRVVGDVRFDLSPAVPDAWAAVLETGQR